MRIIDILSIYYEAALRYDKEIQNLLELLNLPQVLNLKTLSAND